MEYLIAVFRARTQTINFANILRNYKIPVLVINTPRNINVSCGISVKFPSIYRNQVEDIINRRNFDTFAGIFPV